MKHVYNRIPSETANRFAMLALENVVREYPNKLGHVMMGPNDVRRPRELHPIFFGSFDWHSCVHGYWLLAHLYRTVDDLELKKKIEQQINSAFTTENVEGEIRYLQRPENASFERPYGWAWLLMLCHELSQHQHDQGKRWHAQLMPMADLIANRFLEYLPKADYPSRAGMHINSAFALVLAGDYASSHRNTELLSLLQLKARQWYQHDESCQAWEPSQADFLSPTLMEALCMLRMLPPNDFQDWFSSFLPNLGDRIPAALFEPAKVSDRTDGHIAHLDGLNLSRAWCYRQIAASLAAEDSLKAVMEAAAETHLKASLPHVFGDYAGEHWLATFALLALS